MANIGLIGLGAIGRVHYECWRKSRAGRLVAVSDRHPGKLAGDWAGKEFNLGDQAQAQVDLSGLATYQRALDLIADPQVQIVDICMPTLMHAPLTIAALRAGKHVFCEKPMSLTVENCLEMERAAQEADRRLVIGHCLRYWPQYVKAQEILASGEYGRVIYANLFRFSPAPLWSDNDWYMKSNESGGVFDMHIHDIDVALWWFGRPHGISVSGSAPKGLPMIIDAAWRYEGGPAVNIHASWDRHGGTFRHAFRIIMEKATLLHDMAIDPEALFLLRGSESTRVPIEICSAYEAELEDFAASVETGRPTRLTPAESRLAVEIGLEELRQLGVTL
jgi:1,5-anhydro-D-fructose reductase (1,5-anhydro-D-mannitol-forming)